LPQSVSTNAFGFSQPFDASPPQCLLTTISGQIRSGVTPFSAPCPLPSSRRLRRCSLHDIRQRGRDSSEPKAAGGWPKPTVAQTETSEDAPEPLPSRVYSERGPAAEAERIRSGTRCLSTPRLCPSRGYRSPCGPSFHQASPLKVALWQTEAYREPLLRGSRHSEVSATTRAVRPLLGFGAL
jgi:hypothetical protein